MSIVVRDGLAERRLSFARALGERGDWEGARSILAETVEHAPDWDALRFALAEALERVGRFKEARDSYAAYLRLAPADAMGARAHLALLGFAVAPDRLPAAYVRTLFDQYAQRFDRQLVEGLAYRGPAQLRAAVDAARPPGPATERVLDWGCGTGLAGAEFRDRACRLEGVDLSPAMIAKARAKALYDALHVQDILDPLPAEAAGGVAFELIVAADVAVYLGDLAPLMARARALLAHGGLFAFTVQAAATPEAAGHAGFTLGTECRYSHTAPYVLAEADRAGFAVHTLEPTTCRREAGRDVPSLIIVLAAG